MVDEMDLAGQALDVTPWRPEEYERARAVLRGAMAESEYRRDAAPMPEVTSLRERGSSRMGNRRHKTMGARGKIGIGAGLGAVAAAAVAVALVGTSAPPPAGATAQSGTTTGSSAKPSGASTGSVTARSSLMQLAADVIAEPKQQGDATLVERVQGDPGAVPIKVWDLYADDGQYFFSRTKAGLPAQVKEDNDQNHGYFTAVVAAAKYAVTGNLDTALLKMAWAGNKPPVPAWLSSQVKDMSVGGQGIDDYVWENSLDALTPGSGDRQVRAGVLRLLSALPGITVTKGTAADGQPTLTLAAGASELGLSGMTKPDKAHPKGVETGPANVEEITINADTGVPLLFASGTTGHVIPYATYVITRVSLANIKAGKFSALGS